MEYWNDILNLKEGKQNKQIKKITVVIPDKLSFPPNHSAGEFYPKTRQAKSVFMFFNCDVTALQ